MCFVVVCGCVVGFVAGVLSVCLCVYLSLWVCVFVGVSGCISVCVFVFVRVCFFVVSNMCSFVCAIVSVCWHVLQCVGNRVCVFC